MMTRTTITLIIRLLIRSSYFLAVVFRLVIHNFVLDCTPTIIFGKSKHMYMYMK